MTDIANTPWRAYEGLHGDWTVLDSSALWVADEIDGEATARLIAAAPELLKALEICAQVLAKEIDVPFEECVSGPIGVARAAIAKAKGETA